MADVPGVDVAASNRNRKQRSVLSCTLVRTARAVLRVLPSLVGTVARTEGCWSRLQGQPCLARTDLMPPARGPNHSWHSISHLPPKSHPSGGRTLNQQRLRTCCCRPGRKTE